MDYRREQQQPPTYTTGSSGDDDEKKEDDYRWHFDAGKYGWQAYGDHHQWLMDQAFQSGADEVTLKIKKREYLVNFTHMTQKNLTTDMIRDVHWGPYEYPTEQKHEPPPKRSKGSMAMLPQVRQLRLRMLGMHFHRRRQHQFPKANVTTSRLMRTFALEDAKL